MLLSWVVFGEGEDTVARLCLVPKEDSIYARPVPVDILKDSKTAVYHVGPKEAVSVNEEAGGVRKIVPIPPALIYLTPDNPERPGQRTIAIKISQDASGQYAVSYAKDTLGQSWANWEANKVRE